MDKETHNDKKYNLLVNRFISNKVKTAFYIVILLIVIVSLIVNIVQGKFGNIPTYLLILALLSLPTLVELIFKIKMPTVLEVVILLFIFACYYLGEINSFYSKIPYWDMALHTINGFVSAGIGCGFINILNRKNAEQSDFTPIFIVIFSFGFSMMTGAMWELIEFSMDSIIGTDMQKDTFLESIHSYNLYSIGHGDIGWLNDISEVVVNGKKISTRYIDIGLIDSMKDLLMNFIGAVVFEVICFINLKSNKSKGRFIKNFIPYRIEDRGYRIED